MAVELNKRLCAGVWTCIRTVRANHDDFVIVRRLKEATRTRTCSLCLPPNPHQFVRSTIALQIASPSPLPPLFVSSARSTCLNLSKIVFFHVVGNSPPLSVMLNLVCPLAATTFSITESPPEENLMALDSRLTTTCISLSASAYTSNSRGSGLLPPPLRASEPDQLQLSWLVLI